MRTYLTENNHNTYGGKIYMSDFDTDFPAGTIANRIASDMKFDKKCIKFDEIRERKKEFKKRNV